MKLNGQLVNASNPARNNVLCRYAVRIRHLVLEDKQHGHAFRQVEGNSKEEGTPDEFSIELPDLQLPNLESPSSVVVRSAEGAVAFAGRCMWEATLSEQHAGKPLTIETGGEMVAGVGFGQRGRTSPGSKSRSIVRCRLASRFLFALIVLPAGLHAQPSATGGAPAAGESVAGEAAKLPAIVVTGTRLPTTASALAQDVTVIDQAEVRASGASRVEELLMRVPGLYVDQVGRSGGFSSVYIRGAEQSHLLILLDGVKLNDPTTTRGSAYDLSSIDVDQVDRIEVLRGPASAVHGSEALAGVLNIITHRSATPGTSGSAHVGVGGDGFAKAGASLFAGNDQWRGQVSTSHSEDGKGDDGSLRLNSIDVSMKFTPTQQFGAEVFANRVERSSRAFPDDSGGPRRAENRGKTIRESTDSVYGLRLGGGNIDVLRVDARASIFERTEHSDNPAIAPGVRFPVPAFINDTDFRRSTFNLTATRAWGSSASLVVGVENQTEKGTLASAGDFDFDGAPEQYSFALKRTTRSVFAESSFQLGKPVTLQLGLRHDKIEEFNAQTTPHLGIVWELGSRTTLKANYGKGFKPPSFFALGYPIGGNPGLRPEASRNTEVNVTHRFQAPRSSVSVSAFRIDYSNLVDFDATTFTNINRGTIRVTGIEPALKYQFSKHLHAQLAMTVLRIDELDGLAPLRNRPTRKATASVRYDIDGSSSIIAVANAVGHFLDRSNPTGDVRMPGYGTLDLASTHKINRTLSASVSLDNVFDRYYEQFVGFPARARRLRLELRGRF